MKRVTRGYLKNIVNDREELNVTNQDGRDQRLSRRVTSDKYWEH